MLSKEKVKHIAKLARLGLTEKEIETAQKDLSSILSYIEKLKEVDTTGIEPTSHSILVENVMREDVVKKEDPERINKLIEAAPKKKKGYIKVKSVWN
ncbi:Asp-tRNA(Asn)/Glu-tRNA(Gln) amidotransferase subunit GatC [bacterium]|nr:Asp-tRNA(Asn)/Glu-tRNA(Gln) amidotransferase subunit GatC [bacterium]